MKFLIKETIELQKEIEAETMEEAELIYRELNFDELTEIVIQALTDDEPHLEVTEVK